LSAVPGIHVLHHPSVLGGYVYILASSPNGILYIAGDERSCAANLRASEWLVAGFTKKYSVKRLVYKSIPEATTRLAALKRGECCSYYFVLEVWDKSICPSLSGGRHEASWIWPIYVCNDLK
jgi:predicted GIY-YIG superfamily endonuclease